MKRKIYLVQTDILRSTTRFFTAYLPYAVGQLWAYALQNETVRDNYDLGAFIYLRDKPEEVIASMDDPFLVGFSCYVWNTEYNKALARAVKARFPDCVIVFGGHNVPPGSAFLEDFSFIDFLIHGEGEVPFCELLCALMKDKPDFSGVPGLSWRKDSGVYGTNPGTHLESLEALPSPYLTGLFDEIYDSRPDIQWSMLWETNRGCPYHCAYCDWSVLQSNIRCVSMERLMAEIAWMGEHKIEFVWGADSNFGIFPRDEELVDALVAEHGRSGYPYKYNINYAKNSDDRVFRIVKKLNDKDISHFGTTLSLQSLSPEVLKNIGRENLNPDYFARLLRRYARHGIKCYSELILGLPGETFESFRKGIARLIEMGQHFLIAVYPCFLLPNSRLAQADMLDNFKPEVVRTVLVQARTDASEEGGGEIPEYTSTIVGTDTLPGDDWLNAMCFFIVVQAMHCFGLLRFFAVYLHEQGVAYDNFYFSMLKWLLANPQTVGGGIMRKMLLYYKDMQQGNQRRLLRINRISPTRLREDEGVYAACCLDSERFYREISAFLKPYFKDVALFDELLKYQKEMVRLPDMPKKNLELSYDFPKFINAVYEGAPIKLEKKSITLRLTDDRNPKSWIEWQDKTLFEIKGSSDAMFYKTEEIENGNTL